MSFRSLAWTSAVFLLLCTGPLAATITAGSGAGPAPAAPYADEDAAPSLTHAATLGPLPPLPAFDAGAQLGVGAGAVVLDGARVTVAQAVANHFARNGEWSAYPFGPAPPVAPDGDFASYARRNGLDPVARARLALLDDDALGDQGALLTALEAQEDLQRLGERIETLAASAPGGKDAFFALLDKEARGETLTATERSRLDARLTDSLRDDLEGPMALAHLLFPAAASHADPILANPWAGLAAEPMVPALEAAQMAAQARQASDPIAFLSQTFGVTPRAMPEVSFEQAVADYAAALSPDEARALARTIEAAAQAQEAASAAYGAIPQETWDAAKDAMQEILDAAEPRQTRADLDPDDILFLIASLIDDGGLVQDLAQATSDVLATVQSLQDAFGGSPSSAASGQLAVGNVLRIGSAGDDILLEDASVMIEPSGNDIHRQATPYAGYGSFMMVVDLEGHDRYEPASGAGSYCGGIATGMYGAGIGVDLVGNDVYLSGGCMYGLGAGVLGLGTFWDATGDDTYDLDTRDFYQGLFLGAGVEGGGIAMDGAGNDRYLVKSTSQGAILASSGLGGAGFFVEGAGDDAYSNSAGNPTFGGTTQPGVARFTDLEGNDAYVTKGPGFGYGGASVATFLDADGTDSYEAGSYRPAQCFVASNPCLVTNDQAWVGRLAGMCVLVACPANSNLATGGADVDLGAPSSPGNVQPRIVAPRSGSQIATGETVAIDVSAINTGAGTVNSVMGTVTLVSTTEDAVPGQPLGQEVVDFGSVAPGERSDRTVYWTAPAQERMAQLRLAISGAGDTDPSDNLAIASVAIADVRSVSVDDVYVTASGKVRPGMAIEPSALLRNNGNVEYDGLPVTLTITKAGSPTPDVTVVQDVALGRPGPFYDPGADAVELPVAFSLNAPAAEGMYSLKIAVDAAENEADPAAAARSVDMDIEVIRDLAVEPLSPSFLADPGIFLGDDGYGVVVRNRGTVPITGATLTLSTRMGAQFVQAPTVQVPELDADESMLYRAPMLATAPEVGDSWRISAGLVVASDALPSNNAFVRNVQFEPDIAFALDFEAPDASQEPAAGSRWALDVPTHTSTPNEAAGPQAWTTGLGAPFPEPGSARNHDLILRDIDLGDYLDPRMQFQHHTDGVYGSPPSYNYGLVYSVAVSAAGADDFVRIEPEGGYPCRLNYNQADNGPGFCGNAGWEVARFDLAAYTGTAIDLRLRVSTPSYLYGDARGWTIDDMRFFGVRRQGQDLQVVDVEFPQPALSDLPNLVTAHVRNNGYTALDAIDVDLRVRKGTNGALQSLQTSPVGGDGMPLPPGTPLQPLEVRPYTVAWTADTASLHSYEVVATTSGADPRPANNIATGQVAVYDLVGDLDPETAVASQWTTEASISPQDWALGVPGAGETPRKAATGTRVWATNLNGGYTKPEDVGRSGYYETLIAPPTVISAASHVRGDQYVMAVTHQYEIQPSYCCNYRDLVYATANVNGAYRLLEPEGGYPASSAVYSYYGLPPNNGPAVGYTLSSDGYESAVFPLGALNAGDVVSPAFNLFANYCYQCDRPSGWTIDDVKLLRAPRFDDDLKVSILGPALLDIGTTESILLEVSNVGRRASPEVPVLVTLDLAGGPLTVEQTVPAIDPGTFRVVSVPLQVPLEVGLRDVHAALEWGADEWALNDEAETEVRLASVIYRNDFESGGGGFRPDPAGKFQLGKRPDGPNIQGRSSWFTGSWSQSYSSQRDSLSFPTIDVDTGVRYPEVLLSGQMVFDPTSCGGYNSYYGNFRLTDQNTQEQFRMAPADLIDMYSYYAPGGRGHCVKAPIGEPFAFAADLTHRQGADSKLDLVLDAAYYYAQPGNSGMELDDVAVYAVPYFQNVGLTQFTSPPGGLLGPGEEVPVSVEVIGAGIGWPAEPIGVHIVTNDALGPGGGPSVDEIVPVPPLALNERFLASVLWRPAVALDGQSLLVSARLVELGSGIPLIDEEEGDNLLQLPVSVLSIHHMTVGIVADPNVDPDQVQPVNVAAEVRNLGTRTENGVQVILTYRDEQGNILKQTPFPAVQKRPDASLGALRLGETWTPPGPGHYHVEASLAYAAQALDADPSSHLARTQVHAASLPDRFGSAFDGADPTDGWSAIGGLAARGGFLPVEAPDAPEGNSVLATGAYEPNARYTYTLTADLPAASSAALQWSQSLDLGAGDKARLLASRDGGASWQELASFTGSSDWSDESVDLAAVRGGLAQLRFLLEADGSDEGDGWSIDGVQVIAGGAPRRTLGFEDPFGEILQAWDFESGAQGWQHTADAPAGASSGIDDWEVGTPTDGVAPHSGARIWKTNLDGDYTMPCYSPCPTPDNTYGARRLLSPTITVPTGRDQVSLTWWQWLQVFPGGSACPYGYCYSTSPDLASVHLLVDGQPTPVVPATGYGASGPESRAVGGRGWSGSSGAWQFQSIDLSEFAGKQVQVVYQLATPSAAGDFARGYYVKPPQGDMGGFAIDDVRVQASTATATANTAVVGFDLDVQPLTGRPTEATVRLVRTGATVPVDLTFVWIGKDGAALPVPDPVTLDVGPAGAQASIVLPGVDMQHTLLRIVASSSPDARPADDVLEIPIAVEGLVYATAFGSSGDSACGKTTPCASWSHSALQGTDEWEHGAIGSSKHPGSAKSAPYAFATDIAGRTYEVNSQYQLTSPALVIPAEGAILRFNHAMEANAYYCCGYVDGGRMEVGGTLLKPDAGYGSANCGYYADSLPCWHGKFGWTPESVLLDQYAGRTINVDFIFSSGPTDYPVADPPASGWAIDDVTVSSPPPKPANDLELRVPPTVAVDAHDPKPIPIVVANLGTAASAPARVQATFLRDGVPTTPLLFDVPGIQADGDRAVLVPLPGGSLSGLELDLRLVDALGQAWRDGIPGNDRGVASLRLTYTAFELEPVPGASPMAGDRDQPAFTVATPPAEGGAPEMAFVAGLGDGLALEQALVLPAVAVPPRAELDFRHRVRMSGIGDGAFVEASLDGGRSWAQLDPIGGSPSVASPAGASPCVPSTEFVGRCFSGDLPWEDVRVPLDALAGKLAWLRFRYVTSEKTPNDGGWAIGDIRMVADGQAENLLQAPRWAAGPITNPGGPLEEASQPNAWGTGLAVNSGRANGFDVLQSPPIASGDMMQPTIGFDWYGAPENGGSLLVQVLGTNSEWRTIGAVAERTSLWSHAEFPLGAVGDWTQVRFVSAVPDQAKAPPAAPGFFLDNVVVGSLRGEVEVVLGLEEGTLLDAAEATSVTLPVRLANPGVYTNRYQLEVRGLDPTWTGDGGAPVTLGPGQEVLRTVSVDIPYLREPGQVPVVVLARSLFDPLQAAVDKTLLNVSVAPKPDYVVKSIGFQSSFLVEGDPLRHVEDARPNTLIAEIENVGLIAGEQDLEVLFVEHYANGEVRPIDVAWVPTSNLTAPGHPLHASYGAFVEWFPRKGVTAVEVIANPEAQGNRFPANPESSFDNNLQFAAVVVEPRPLPELVYAATPAFSRMPQVGLPVTLGVDVRNGGNAPSLTPVDVALLASPSDAFLTSPPLELPSNSLLRVVYSSDLELRADGFVVEVLEDGSWTRVVPTGGYPNGCLLGLGCESGVSGRADHRMMTFDLAGWEGPSQVRLRFGMDSHNGRTFDGLQLHEVFVQQFGQTPYRFDFSSSSAAWTASPQYTAKDGTATTLFQYRGKEGPIPGTWSIPTNYVNPYLVALRSIKPVATGGLEHANLDWTPRAGGDQDLRLLVDPKNSEPEYVDDLNRLGFAQRVAVSGFDLRANAPPCGSASFCLADAQGSGDFPVRLANTGNTRSHFEVKLQSHPFLEAKLLVGDRALTGIELEAGQVVDGVLNVRAHGAPAGVHTLQFDVLDSTVGKTTKIGVTVRVQSASTLPLKVTGLSAFQVVASATQTVTLENPGNQVVPVLLRAGDKPAGLAMRVSPSEFTLAPFESRSIEIELLNLGVAAKTHTLDLVNARAACPQGQASCGVVARLTAHVAEYAPPVAEWSVSEPLRPNEPALFRDASRSTGSTVTAWRWDFGDGSSSTLAQPTHAYAKPGVYSVLLTVTDAQGHAAQSAARTVTVVNDAPKAVARHTLSPVAGVPLNFSAAESLDVDGGIAKVTWAFGDGTLVVGLDVSHTYREAGTYRVVVAVEDAFGAVDVYEMTVEVAPGAVFDLAEEEARKESPLPAWTALVAVALLAVLRRRRRA